MDLTMTNIGRSLDLIAGGSGLAEFPPKETREEGQDPVFRVKRIEDSMVLVTDRSHDKTMSYTLSREGDKYILTYFQAGGDRPTRTGSPEGNNTQEVVVQRSYERLERMFADEVRPILAFLYQPGVSTVCFLKASIRGTISW